MHSSWNLWDYFKNHSEPVSANKMGLYSFSLPDPYIYKVIHDKVHSALTIRTISATMMTAEWIEENLCTLSLFGAGESFIVSNAEELSKDAYEFFFERSPDLTDRHLVFFFNREAPYRKKLIGVGGTHVTIEAPKFWEMDKFLDFLGNYYNVRLAYDAKQFFLEIVDNEASSFHVAMNILSLNFPNKKEITVEDLQSVLEQNRLDQFYLASLFSRKEKNKFYGKLMQAEADFDTLRQFFSFLQGHLIKLGDTSVIEKKARLTKYDKEIVSLSKLWSLNELESYIKLFAELEIMAKMRSELLLPKIRLKFFQTLA